LNDACALRISAKRSSRGRGIFLLILVVRSVLGIGAMGEAQALSARIEAVEQAGRAIRLRLRIRNESGRALTLMLGGRPAYDFLVKRLDGTLVWRWQQGKVVQQILERRRLAPGEEVVFEATWRLGDARGRRVPAGEYVVHGILHLEPPEKLSTDPLRVYVPPLKRSRWPGDRD